MRALPELGLWAMCLSFSYCEHRPYCNLSSKVFLKCKFLNTGKTLNSRISGLQEEILSKSRGITLLFSLFLVVLITGLVLPSSSLGWPLSMNLQTLSLGLPGNVPSLSF